jgi:hypothetical protein
MNNDQRRNVCLRITEAKVSVLILSLKIPIAVRAFKRTTGHPESRPPVIVHPLGWQYLVPLSDDFSTYPVRSHGGHPSPPFSAEKYPASKGSVRLLLFCGTGLGRL